MTDWTSGYVAEIDYTFGYYPELNPLTSKFALKTQGLAVPNISTACELGFGQGISANIHSASSDIEWYATDFNPSQAAFAQKLSMISGLRAYNDAFADFLNRTDLPDFDFIGLHGIWTWISDENRQYITDFIRRKLKVGGILYISYNTLPGWSTAAPLRHLFSQHNNSYGAPGQGIINRVESALDFSQKLLALNPLWARANPSVVNRLEMIRAQNKSYLAHEYFNVYWQPMYFAEMVSWLENTKVEFATSANFTEMIDALNYTVAQQEFLSQFGDPIFKETLKDYLINQQFRRDYWVKGHRLVNSHEKAVALREQHLVLCVNHDMIEMKAKGVLGEATLSENIYRPLLEVFADYQVKTLHEVEIKLSSRNISLSQIVQACAVLVGQGSLYPANDPTTSKKVSHKSQSFNKSLIEIAQGSSDVSYLASPVLGGGVGVGRFHQLFIQSLQQGKKKPAEWANDVWDLLSKQGQTLVKDGKTLETVDENISELIKQGDDFLKNRVPILKSLLVI